MRSVHQRYLKTKDLRRNPPAETRYLHHGDDKPLLACVFKPRGEGPLPALVGCHSGAWCLSDRNTERLRHQAMAAHGIASIALNFRLSKGNPIQPRPRCKT